MASLQRHVAWTQATHDFRAERRQTAFALRNPDQSFNKAGIMKRAHQLAKRLTPSCGLSYRERLATSLRTAFQQARAAGRPASPAQIDRRWPLSRLLASALEARS